MNENQLLLCSCGSMYRAGDIPTRHCPDCDEWMHLVREIRLVKEASGENYSLEAGLADGVKNFDHHGDFAEQPAPCNDERIEKIPSDAVIEITHLDADTLMGIFRMCGYVMPADIDLDLMEKIDVKGSSFLSQGGLGNHTRQYMVGVNDLAREENFPRWQDEDLDVSKIVYAITRLHDKQIMMHGLLAMEKGEDAYQRSLQTIDQHVAFIIIAKGDSVDPSRAYADECDVVIIYREAFRSISIYGNPKPGVSPELAGIEFAGIEFAGQPRACGSPRGEEYAPEDAKRVFLAVRNMIETWYDGWGSWWDNNPSLE